MWHLRCDGDVDVPLIDGTYFVEAYPQNIIVERKEEMIKVREATISLLAPIGAIVSGSTNYEGRVCEFVVSGNVISGGRLNKDKPITPERGSFVGLIEKVSAKDDKRETEPIPIEFYFLAKKTK